MKYSVNLFICQFSYVYVKYVCLANHPVDVANIKSYQSSLKWDYDWNSSSGMRVNDPEPEFDGLGMIDYNEPRGKLI